MKRKLLAYCIALSVAMLFFGCSALDQTADKTENKPNNTQTVQDPLDMDAAGNISVDERLFDVTLTIPADYIGEATQETLDAEVKEKGFKSATLNEDGSATYVMTKAQHNEMMKELSDDISRSLEEMIGSEDYPNVVAIDASNDYTEFTITTRSSELDFNEAFSVMQFYIYGGMYNIFNGTPVDNVSVTFVNETTGEIIETANSSDT